MKDHDLFVAIKGSEVDGHKYIDNAIAQGAAAVVCEVMPFELKVGVCYIQVKDSEEALGLMAGNYYIVSSNIISHIYNSTL